MRNFSSVKEIKVLSDPTEVNKLLKDWWELLEIYKTEDFRIMFVLGRSFYKSIGEFRGDCECKKGCCELW